MRGPGYRLDLDVRRVWRCPQCAKERRLGGEVTAVACACGRSMEIVDERRSHVRSNQPLVSRELTVESFALTEEELSQPLPARMPRPPADSSEAPAAKPRGQPPARQPPSVAVSVELEPPAAVIDEAPPPTVPAEGDFGDGLEDAPQ